MQKDITKAKVGDIISDESMLGEILSPPVKLISVKYVTTKTYTLQGKNGVKMEVCGDIEIPDPEESDPQD